jgi:lactobin A/cerein 7B family class IIb bacteriocin
MNNDITTYELSNDELNEIGGGIWVFAAIAVGIASADFGYRVGRHIGSRI